MRKDKLISDYSKWTDFELSTLAGRVLAAMEDENVQTNFESPDPPLDEIESLVTEFITKHEVASRRGSALEISLKNEARDALLKGLKRLAHYVNGVADGRTSLLLSTGLVLVAPRKPSKIPTRPERVRLRDGQVSGMLRFDFIAVPHTWEYEVEVGESEFGSENVEWKYTMTTTNSRGNILTDVVPGMVYSIRVRARNAKGVGEWSDVTSLLAR